jgi:hypothetical protein
MSETGSEHDAPPDGAYQENDHKETILGYGKGGVPFYIAILWVLFIVAYVIAMATLVLPDLTKWATR